MESALVDEDHLLGSFCLTSILSVASRNLVTAFRRIKVVNKLVYSVICSLISQYITYIFSTEQQFCAKDVCDVLGYKRARYAVAQLVNHLTL